MQQKTINVSISATAAADCIAPNLPVKNPIPLQCGVLLKFFKHFFE